ncbi:hypothetical protein PV326_009635 [Microctonus aethiopoides]|nr:hypothetical protein PV326_009635 [Microctonus aethiopoides]
MIDGNISMEEDTELRDLVVQTLENNGVLAKVRAELRASVFLALEEQESVANPDPLLNKTVKQYLGNSEGKLLFSLVREFLEYFGLDYTISVYDPETYFGKEYNYIGRNKLCEKLGINSTEPLLGELLKNSINGAFNNSKNETANDSRLSKLSETSTNFNNATFEVSVPKIVHKDSTSLSNDNDSSDKAESVSDINQEVPINVTITDKKLSDNSTNNLLNDNSNYDLRNRSLCVNSSFENTSEPDKIDEMGNNNLHINSVNSTIANQIIAATSPENETDNPSKLLNKTDHLIKFDESVEVNNEEQITLNENASKSKIINSVELQNTNNAQNRRIVDVENNFGSTVYFDEIIADGKKEKIVGTRKTESLLGELPPLGPKSNAFFSDLPPLNGKKTNINDLKALMEIGLTGDGADNYEEDFMSSASGSANEQSPAKDPDKRFESSPINKDETSGEEKSPSARSEEISEEIDIIEELEDTSEDKSVTNCAMGVTSDNPKEA